MVIVPAGRFMMGSPGTRASRWAFQGPRNSVLTPPNPAAPGDDRAALRRRSRCRRPRSVAASSATGLRDIARPGDVTAQSGISSGRQPPVVFVSPEGRRGLVHGPPQESGRDDGCRPRSSGKTPEPVRRRLLVGRCRRGQLRGTAEDSSRCLLCWANLGSIRSMACVGMVRVPWAPQPTSTRPRTAPRGCRVAMKWCVFRAVPAHSESPSLRSPNCLPFLALIDDLGFWFGAC